MSKEIATPDWSNWLHVQNVNLWEGVLLAANIEPEDWDYDADDLEDRAKDNRQWKRVRSWLLVACRNVGMEGRLLHNYPYPANSTTAIPLRDFVVWSRSVGWDIPPELAVIVEQSQQVVHPPSDGSQTNSEFPFQLWPWGRHETDLLRHMAAAARKWWANYDPGDPTTAPTNEQVAGWLQDERGLSSDRMANAIATILRADKLPPGPRT